MAFRLCADEWRHVSAFLQSPALSHVCLQTWNALQRRHLLWLATSSNVSEMMTMLKDDPAVHTLTIHCKDIKDGGARQLAVLKDVPSLTSLRLHLKQNRINEHGAEAFAALKEAPLMTALSINLERNQIKDHGAGALAMLKHSHLMQTLSLNLSGNQLTDKGKWPRAVCVTRYR